MFFKSFLNKKRIYLDFASSTPRDPKMVKAFNYQKVINSNPSSLHYGGISAKKILNFFRKEIADQINAHPEEIIFTSGATESNNLALQGLFNNALKQGISPQEILIYTSNLEHASVTEVAKFLHTKGAHYVALESENGIINPKDIIIPENIKFIIVSIIFVQNEIGTIMPIKDIAKRLRFLKKENPDIQIIFHTDATQAPLYFHLGVPQLGIDLMSIGSTKLYCSRGSGFLYKRRAILLEPIIYGGGQEFGLRPGTEAVSLISEFSQSFLFAQNNVDYSYNHILDLRNYFEIKIKALIPNIIITASDTERSPHITHLSISEFDSELFVLELDARGIEVSARSACKNESDQNNSLPKKLVPDNFGTIRFSFGRTTTKIELDYALKAVVNVLKKYKKI